MDGRSRLNGADINGTLTSTGNTSLGATTTNGHLTTRSGATLQDIRVSKGWNGYPDSGTDRAEISNDTGTFKKLMIVGNKSAGTGKRVVGVWDRLDVHGELCINDSCTPQCKQMATPWRDDTGGTWLDNMSTQDVSCPNNQYLSRMKVSKNPQNGKQYRYDYTCCSMR